jgi:hypothetical protein
MATKKKADKLTACPNCGGELEAAAVPTDAQYNKAFDRENPTGLPPHFDTANPAQRAELGPLYRCVRCEYKHREAPSDADAK